MEGFGSRSVYMITGLKTARGASKRGKLKAKAQLMLKDPGGLSVGGWSKLMASKKPGRDRL